MGSKRGLRSHRGWASREQGDLGKAGQRSELRFLGCWWAPPFLLTTLVRMSDRGLKGPPPPCPASGGHPEAVHWIEGSCGPNGFTARHLRGTCPGAEGGPGRPRSPSCSWEGEILPVASSSRSRNVGDKRRGDREARASPTARCQAGVGVTISAGTPRPGWGGGRLGRGHSSVALTNEPSLPKRCRARWGRGRERGTGPVYGFLSLNSMVRTQNRPCDTPWWPSGHFPPSA